MKYHSTDVITSVINHYSIISTNAQKLSLDSRLTAENFVTNYKV